jgi:hypothetical protein
MLLFRFWPKLHLATEIGHQYSLLLKTSSPNYQFLAAAICALPPQIAKEL